MHLKHKSVSIAGIKTSGLEAGQFEGFASVFDHLDHQGDIVRRGAFAKALGSGRVTPLIWEHQSNDPRAFVGEVKAAEETDEGLKILGQFDMDTEAGQAAYRQVKARRVTAMSIGYSVRDQRKSADGAVELLDLDLREISLVARPANDRATISAVKASTDTSAAGSAIVAARQLLAKAAEGDDPAAAEAEDAQAEMTVGERLLASLEAATAAAEEIISAAEDEGRDLTAEEADDVTDAARNINTIKGELRRYVDASPAGRLGFQYQHDVIGKGMDSLEFHKRWGDNDAPAAEIVNFTADHVGIKTKNQETTIVDTNAPQFLALRKGLASAAAKGMVGTEDTKFSGGSVSTGTKALTASGQITTDVPTDKTPIPTGRPAVSLLDVLPTNKRSTPTWRYLRQSARDLKAAPVAEGGTKPTSDVSVQTIDAKASVIAHISTPVDKFVLQDNGALGRFLTDEMAYGLDVAVQDQILNGDGTGANLTGILNTSGVQVQAFATDVLTSVRKAITAQESLGYAPSVLAVSPADWEALELLAATDAAVGYRGVPLDQGERRIWGLTAVLSNALPAKTAVVLDPAAVSVDVVGGIDVEWDGAGSLFAKNQVQVRVEGRFGLSVYQPAAIVKVATAA